MFKKETVFVLGAGASWHYGYPTGERLVQDVLANARRYLDYCTHRVNAGVNIGDMPRFMRADLVNPTYEHLVGLWHGQAGLCRELISTLEDIDPLVIDYFLGWNERVHDIGRLMIAASLLERETGAKGENYNRKPASGVLQTVGKDHWLRFVVHQMLVGCRGSEDLLKNKVSFITFNYDRSLERVLQRSLAAVAMLNGAHIDEFLGGKRIIHLYGALTPHANARREGYQALEANFRSQNSSQHISDANELIDLWYATASEIRVIDPHNKTSGRELEPVQRVIRAAEKIYFLGFGFDELNLQRLGFPLARDFSRSISYTNLNDSMTINKRAAKAFEVPNLIKEPIAMRGMQHVERSTRTVYDAIEFDFGALAE